ncbi:MAG: NAD(P)-dependent oxidoreductase [Bacteroidaceae bacterium]|nr:NAD(P)-dependent oxidoreductase [Bacteroidaceae bacterium]
MQKRILVTGASGFIGSFICQEGLDRGFEVWAGMRGTSSSQFLTDERLKFATLDLGNYERLCSQLRDLKAQMDGHGWDYVVHAAGATKSLKREGFFKVNTEGTLHLVNALRAEDMMPERFIFVSSLSVFGAVREQPVRKATADNPWIYAPIVDTDTPQPNTAYGESKLKAEQWLDTQTDLPCVTLRLTGVYGPRERDYFLMAQSIKQHIDFAAGFSPQEITFVYVRDVVQAVFQSFTAPNALGKKYFLSDGQVYNSRAFSDLLQRELGNPWVLHLKAPLWFLKAVCAVSGTVSKAMGKLTTLNLDKYHILSQRNWQCDIAPARRDLGYNPEWPLDRGVVETVAWYKQAGWL